MESVLYDPSLINVLFTEKKKFGLCSSLDFYHLQGTDYFSVDPIYSHTFYYLLIYQEGALKFYRETKTDTETQITYSIFKNLCKVC